MNRDETDLIVRALRLWGDVVTCDRGTDTSPAEREAEAAMINGLVARLLAAEIDAEDPDDLYDDTDCDLGHNAAGQYHTHECVIPEVAS